MEQQTVTTGLIPHTVEIDVKEGGEESPKVVRSVARHHPDVRDQQLVLVPTFPAVPASD
jgi:hypothetical protein